jgi:hypothetical protein
MDINRRYGTAHHEPEPMWNAGAAVKNIAKWSVIGFLTWAICGMVLYAMYAAFIFIFLGANEF